MTPKDLQITLLFRMRKINSIIWDFLSSGTYQENQHDFQVLYRYMLVNITCIFTATFLLPFGIYDIIQGVQPLGTHITILGIIVTGNILFLRQTKLLHIASTNCILILIVLFSYLLLTGGSNNTGPLWAYSLPMAAIFLMGLRGGSILLTLYIAFAACCLFIPDFPLVTATYTFEFKKRFIPTFLAATVLAVLVERVRSMINHRLRMQKNELTKLIANIRQTETALFHEKELLSTTMRSISEGIITSDKQGKIVLMNQVAENFFSDFSNTTKELTVAKLFSKMTSIDSIPPHELQEEIITRPDSGDRSHYYQRIDHEGQERVIALRWTPLRDSNKIEIGVVLVFRDITERKKLEDELLQAKKLESVATLSTGVSHDFNNLLTGILGFLDLANEDAADNNTDNKYILKALKLSQQAKQLLRQFTSLMNVEPPNKRAVDVHDFLTMVSTSATNKEKFSCEFDIDEKIKPVHIDEQQIAEVITEVIKNAQEAMPNGGTITIGAANIVAGIQGEAIPLPQGEYVKIFIADQGAGIPADSLPKVFDPYYSTKHRSTEKGLGMGLASAYALVTAHGGHIKIESEEGSGTTCNIYLS